MGLISEKEDKMFRKFIEEKATSIAKVLMDVQTSVAKKHDCGIGSNIKNSEEFEFGLEKKITQSLKNMSKRSAVKNAAQLFSSTIIDTFMEHFISCYLTEIKSDEV